MALRMRELMERTGESRSTILYYLKEGLLPPPKKPKPNLHLYDESCVRRIRLIKYLQELSYSIAQIKKIFESNDFDFDDSFETLIAAIAQFGEEGEKFERDRFLELAGIDEERLGRWEEAGYIVPLGGRYGKKDLEAAKILKRAEEIGVDERLLVAYRECAAALAKLENDIGQKLLEDGRSSNERYAILFDLILRYKPYLFGRYTVKEHASRCKERP